MGPEVDQLLETLMKVSKYFITYNEAKPPLKECFVEKKNIIYEKAKFNLRPLKNMLTTCYN